MRKLTGWRRKATFAAVTAALGATTAWSQNASEDSGSVLQEVTITAEFRSTKLQETPIAVTAINAEMLEQRSQTNIFELTAQAPNVQLAPQGQANGSALIAFIRGVGQTDFNFALEPGVGIYIDDVYYPTLTGSLVDLLDLDRVEVLRGPQGTLAGRNSIGGAIKLFSQKPKGDGTGSLSATTGSYSRLDVRGVADFALIPDKLMARISGVTKNRDGYVDRYDYACSHPNSGLLPQNVGTGCKVGTLGGISYTAGRGALRWLATDKLEINFSADLTKDTSESSADVLRAANIGAGDGSPAGDGISSYLVAQDDGNPATPLVRYDCRFVPYGPKSCDPNGSNHPYISYANFIDSGLVTNAGTSPMPVKPSIIPPIQHLTQYGASAIADYAINDSYSIKSITAWRRYNSSWGNDIDGSPLGSQQLLQTLQHWQWSEELRLNGSIPAIRADYTVGGFYFKQGGSLHARVDLNYAHLDFEHGPDTTPSDSKAAFVHSTFHLTDKMDLSAGVRYSKDEKDYTYYRRNPDGTLPACNIPFGTPFGPFGSDQPQNCALAGLFNQTGHFDGTRTDWRVALDYKWTDTFMTYGQISTGYKGGGVNPRPFFLNQISSFNPETLTTYEVGFKSDIFERRMRLNVSAFYNKYKDIILTLNACPGPPCALPSNIGQANVKGIELETEIHPTDNFMIDSSISYLDFQYTQTNQTLTNITLSMVTPYTPDWKASVGMQYTLPLGTAGSLTGRIDGAYTSAVYGQAINAATNRIPDYVVSNARLTWRAQDDRWQTAVEVTNLTNKLYYTSVFDQTASSGSVSYGVAMPRAWAITIKHNFN